MVKKLTFVNRFILHILHALIVLSSILLSKATKKWIFEVEVLVKVEKIQTFNRFFLKRLKILE